MANSFTINIVNNRGDDALLNVLFTANASKNLSGIVADTPEILQISPKSISMEEVTAGRLYVGYGSFPTAPKQPVPEGDQYYGWIEFTKQSTDQGIWINLSNVDLLGLPLALSGTDLEGNAFSLGYNKPIKGIIDLLKTKALTTQDKSAIVTCRSGQTKIVGPNVKPQSYATFDDYLNVLMNAGAKLVITSDKPTGARKVFTGSFLKAVADTDPIINLTSVEMDTFTILKGQFTSELILRCDGGSLIYNGTTIQQNEGNTTVTNGIVVNKDAITIDRNTITNSVYRNILIGMHEGYFLPNSINYSANYPFLSPFNKGIGNPYAQVMHETSNSYGFPYADSNLKVLIQATPTQPLTLTIMKDDEVFGFLAASNESNEPQSGNYTFGIGANSDLGIIEIGNCRYPPNSAGGYGGFLPTLEDWTQMRFSKTGNFIWIKTNGEGFVSGTNCFLSNGNPITPNWGDNVLSFPSAITWNTAVGSPENPNVKTNKFKNFVNKLLSRFKRRK
jgi:hypothetical protein